MNISIRVLRISGIFSIPSRDHPLQRFPSIFAFFCEHIWYFYILLMLLDALNEWILPQDIRNLFPSKLNPPKIYPTNHIWFQDLQNQFLDILQIAVFCFVELFLWLARIPCTDLSACSSKIPFLDVIFLQSLIIYDNIKSLKVHLIFFLNLSLDSSSSSANAYCAHIS